LGVVVPLVVAVPLVAGPLVVAVPLVAGPLGVVVPLVAGPLVVAVPLVALEACPLQDHLESPQISSFSLNMQL
jgi:hypothetical protein